MNPFRKILDELEKRIGKSPSYRQVKVTEGVLLMIDRTALKGAKAYQVEDNGSAWAWLEAIDTTTGQTITLTVRVEAKSS